MSQMLDNGGTRSPAETRVIYGLYAGRPEHTPEIEGLGVAVEGTSVALDLPMGGTWTGTRAELIAALGAEPAEARDLRAA